MTKLLLIPPTGSVRDIVIGNTAERHTAGEDILGKTGIIFP